MNMVVCASPIYWKKHGKPEHPRDLASHEALTFSLLGQQPVWRFDDNGSRSTCRSKAAWTAPRARR
jgi:hypothetical protein